MEQENRVQVTGLICPLSISPCLSLSALRPSFLVSESVGGMGGVRGGGREVTRNANYQAAALVVRSASGALSKPLGTGDPNTHMSYPFLIRERLFFLLKTTESFPNSAEYSSYFPKILFFSQVLVSPSLMALSSGKTI